MQGGEVRPSQLTVLGGEEMGGACRKLLSAPEGSPSQLSLQRVFAQFLEGTRSHLRFDHLGLGFYDRSQQVLELTLQAGDERVPTQVPVLPESLGALLDEAEAIEVCDVENDRWFPDLLELAESHGFRSFRIVPLTAGDQVFGAVTVLRRTAGAFSEENVRHLNHAAQMLALSLEKAVMADVLSREKARLETLLDVNKALISSLDTHKLFHEVSRLIQRIISQDYINLALHDKSSDAMTFYMLDPESGSFVVPPGTSVPVDECPTGISYSRGKFLQFSQPDLESIGSDYTKRLLALGIQTVSCFPLVSHGRRLGAMGLASVHETFPSADEIVLLTQIASQVASAIDNARAYEEIARMKDKLAKEKLYLEQEIFSQHNFTDVVGNSPALCQVLKQVEISAPSDVTVLVLGETGTGKELVARALHRLSSRHEGNFIKLNCAAIPTGLLESELFGHEKGAFTGAVSQKVGRLELADKGTLFLDEIGEIPTEVQPKLLRVLQDHEFERLGGIRTIRVNVRLLAATNRDLAKAVEDHQFRSDLFYRLNVFPIRLPPLRERPGDIRLLAGYFVQKFARRMGKNIESIPEEIMAELEQWHWPGNIRELENFIERSVILTQGVALFSPIGELHDGSKRTGSTLEDVERNYILRTLREAGGVIAGLRGAAARLGMKRTTLQSRMQKLGIVREEYEV